jgi:hypothetical protein
VGGLQPGDIVEAGDVLGGLREVDQQDVPAAERPLDAGDQEDAARTGVVEDAAIGELPIVERERQGVKAEAAGAIDQRERIVRDVVERVFPGMQVEIDFQHGFAVTLGDPRVRNGSEQCSFPGDFRANASVRRRNGCPEED